MSTTLSYDKIQPSKYALNYPIYYEYAKQIALGNITIDEVPVMFKTDAQGLVESPEALIAYVREVKWEEIKAQRDYLESHQLYYNGMILDYDERSALKLEIASTGATGAIQNGLVQESDFAIEWTLKDNTTTQLTYKDLMLIPLAAMHYSDSLHQQGRTYREQIFAETDIAKIEAIRWE